RGVITNKDGGFRLPKRLFTEQDTLQISSMGYQKRDYAIARLSPIFINIIRLSSATISLDEAVVSANKKRRLSARRIVQRAIENIPNNYPLFAYSTKGYYRDYQIDSLGYINLNEAFLEVFDPGFHQIDTSTTKTIIYDYLKNSDFPRDTIADDPYNYRINSKTIEKAYLSAYGGNEFAILRIHDPIRNFKLNSFDFVNVMEAGDVVKNHSFERKLDTHLEGERLFVIELGKKQPGFTAVGKIYISKQDYAIHKLEYAVYDDRKRNKDVILREKGIKGALIFEVVTEYRRDANEKMFLNYISFHNSFRLAIAPKFVIDSVSMRPGKAIRVDFNGVLGDTATAEYSGNYKFEFKKKKLKVTGVDVYSDFTMVQVNLSDKLWGDLVRTVNTRARKRLGVEDVFKIEIKNIVDNEGNILDRWTSKHFNQFREFFVQEISKVANTSPDSLLMNMRKPIFADQPAVKPENYEDYWMNTPFKQLEQQ
ncbi:MAG: hypothetical protein HKN31_06715, partial [Pricia sp.]|nr:hypothetical protein [Pricia sp.]